MYNREYAENALKKYGRNQTIRDVVTYWHYAALDENERFYVRTERTGHTRMGSPYDETCDQCYNCEKIYCHCCEIVWIVEDTNEKPHITHIKEEYDDEDTGVHVIIRDEYELGKLGHSIARLQTKTYEEYEGVLKAVEEWLKEHP